MLCDTERVNTSFYMIMYLDMQAAMEGCGFMVELLIMGGADVNCQDGDWWTPLHVACYHDNFEVVQILLQVTI